LNTSRVTEAEKSKNRSNPAHLVYSHETSVYRADNMGDA